MTAEEIAKLRELAQAATQPSPWTVVQQDPDGGGMASIVLDGHGMWVADCGAAPQDAAFIAAASPSSVLSLIDRLAAANAEIVALRHEVEAMREAADRERRHPMAPDRCPVCEWTNVNLMNYGSPEAGSRWICHGCAARLIRERDSLTTECERLRERAESSRIEEVRWLDTATRRRKAIEAALGAWCPVDPGGDGADGETYRLCREALTPTQPEAIDAATKSPFSAESVAEMCKEARGE